MDQLIQIAGAVLILTAYAGAQFGRLDQHSIAYLVLNLLGSATLAWRLGWVLGFAAVLLLVALEPRLLEPAVWLTGMAVILGRKAHS